MTVRMLAGLALLLGPLWGQDSSAAEPRMVDLNVVAVDDHGQPVADLTRDELRVSDSGKAQTIAYFHHRDASARLLPALGPNEVSNRGKKNIPRATVILFDLLNQDFATRGTSANQLIHDLESLETADYLYLYLLTLDGRLYPVRGLPTEQAEADGPGGEPWTRHVKPMLNEALRATAQVRRPDIDIAVREPITYTALERMADELSIVPGRKNLVWVTDGVPIELGPYRSDIGDFVDFTTLLRRMSEAFERTGTAIYPVRQVMLGSPDNVNGGSGLGSIDTLSQFAQMTGGRPDAGKDIGAAVRQAINDARTSYQIGYYPPPKNWDDKFHKLRVTCTRKGVRIQVKNGYYGWREQPGARSELAIESAIPPAFDAAEIGLRATLSPDPSGAHRVRLDARIDADDVALVHQGERYNAQLRLAIVGYAPSAQPQRGPTIPLDLGYNAQDRDQALRQGINFTQDVTLQEDVRSVRLIVFDRGSDAVGSVTLPVPAFAAAQRK